MRFLLLAAVYTALAFTPTALGTTTDPRLNMVASRIAGHPVTVYCYQHDEPGDPLLVGAWGYIWLSDHVGVNLAAEVCAGALALENHDTTVPQWEQALGALVLAHESYHQHLGFSNRGSEAATECRAIRHFTTTAEMLGATPSQAQDLQPYALAIHYRLAYRFPEYGLKACDVPWWWH